VVLGDMNWWNWSGAAPSNMLLFLFDFFLLTTLLQQTSQNLHLTSLSLSHSLSFSLAFIKEIVLA